MKTIEKTRSTRSGKLVTLELLDGDDHTTPQYIMTGETGTHVLEVEHTDEKRLAAHWRGFCEMNDADNEAMRLDKADPAKIEASRKSLHDYRRAEYAIEFLRARIEHGQEQGRNFDANWGDAGDAAHLRERLLEILDPDGDRGTLAEIDEQIAEENNQ